uniref:ABC transporter domain-containing protein n=1 Tax=Fagus sylvatica TaxID=28930 RepID=A0A2N9G6E4_FAGSY
MVLPFTPLTLVFQDVQYYVDTALEMREWGFPNKRLQLLSKIIGSRRPGVLTALMGVSGSGKTTLLDVLVGRKTSGYIEGQIKIGGYPKVQEPLLEYLWVLTGFDCVDVVAVGVVLLSWRSRGCGVVAVEEPWVLG